MGRYARLKKVAAALRPLLEKFCRGIEEKKQKVGRKGFPLYSKLMVLLLRQILDIKSDVRMEKLLRQSSALRAICKIGRAMDNSTISKARKKIGTLKLRQIWYFLVHECKRLKLTSGRFISVDSTEHEKYYRDDPDSKVGYSATKEIFFDGYRAHLATDCFSELPVAVVIKPGNEHDAKVFDELLKEIDKVFTYEIEKLIADCGYDSAHIRQTARDRGIKDVIARNGRGHFESEIPEDSDYDMRPASERVNSRAKLSLGLENFRLKGLWGATFHSLAVFSGMLWAALGSFIAGFEDFRNVESLLW